MEKLDDQLLIKILGNVPRKDQLKLLRVSKLWYRLMDEKVGIDLMLGNGIQIWEREWNDEDDEPIEALWDSLDILGKVGVRSCQLNNFLNESTTPLPKLKHPNLLSFLSFKNFVSTSTFKSILNSVNNLHTFEIDEAAMRYLDLSDVDIEIPCRALKLYLREDFRHRRAYTQTGTDLRNLQISALNTSYLLRKSFPSVSAVTISLDTLKESQQPTTNEILNFLNNHSGTLISLEIWICVLRPSLDVAKQQMNETLNLPTAMTVPACQFLKLRKLDVAVAYDRCNPSTSTEQWMSWAFQASKLEEISFTFNFSSYFLKSIVEKNSITLTRIELRPKTVTGWPLRSFDCTILQACGQLKFLIIQIPPQGMYWKLHVENTNLLPKSLVKLTIECLHVSSKSCESICLNLPNLKELELFAVGVTDEYGVTAEVVREMIRLKSIAKFHIQTVENVKEDEVLKKFTFDFDSPFYVRCTLDENGEYVRTPIPIPHMFI